MVTAGIPLLEHLSLAVAMSLYGDDSPFLRLRNRPVSGERRSETAASGSSSVLKRPEDYITLSAVPEHEELREKSHSRLMEPMASTPMGPPAGASSQHYGRENPMPGEWHPGSSADLFDRWIDRPLFGERANQASNLDYQGDHWRPLIPLTGKNSDFCNPGDTDKGHPRITKPSHEANDLGYATGSYLNAPLNNQEYRSVPTYGNQSQLPPIGDCGSQQGLRKRTSREVPAPKYDGSSQSFMEFLDDFERVADYNRWDSGDRKFHIWNSIVGNAKIRVKTMRVQSSYEGLLRGLLAAFNNERSIESYRDQLAAVKRSPTMDLETYGHHLLDLTRKAHPTALYEEHERIARDRFLETAGSHNMSVWLKAMRPKTVQDAIDLAIQFQQATAMNCPKKPKTEAGRSEISLSNLFIEAEQPTIQVSAVSGDVKSSEVSTLEDKLQKLTDEFKAFSKQMQQSANKTSVKKGPLKCFECQEIGHFKRNCPKLKAKQPLN